jgi:CHASE2 domain-containing sensor protein
VTPRAERRATAGWIDRIGLVGIVLSLSFAALTKLQPAWADRLQSAWFDAYQSLAPRQVSVLPVTVVEIDQKSLAAIGQWPWPRTQLARLVNTLQRADAASIARSLRRRACSPSSERPIRRGRRCGRRPSPSRRNELPATTPSWRSSITPAR